MVFDRLTRLAQKRAFARIAHPYIIQTYRTRVQELFNILMDYELGSKLKRAYLLRILAPQFISFGNLVPQFFPRFGLIRGIFDRDTIFWLAEQTEVIKIFSDEPMWIAQYPVVPPEGTFSVTYARKLKNFTTTYYTKKLIGADRANFKGFFGDGIKVAIIDSVAEWSPVIIKRPEKGEKLENTQVEIIPISEVVDFEKGKNTTVRGEEIVEPDEDIYIFMGHMHKSNKHWARVKRIIRHKYKGKMIRVVTHTGLVDVTPNHSLIKAGGNPTVISAKKVKIGDRLAMAINDLGRKKTGCEKGTFVGTKELAWLLGLFVAEGSASRISNNRNYLVSISTQDYHLATIVAHLMEKYFNKKPIISSYKDVYKICIQSYGLYKYFRKHFYTKQGDKKIPKFILNAPNNIIEAFLEGYLEGDGWKSSGDNYTKWKKWAGFTTKSQTLAMGLIWLFHRVYGLKHTIQVPYDINYTKAFDVRFVGSHRKDPRKIKKIIEFSYDGYVYDIEVEEDPHTFCTGVGPIKVHNTGSARYHESINRAIFDTVMPSQRTDDNGHGCISPDTYIYVSNYGLITIEEFWNRMDAYSRWNKSGSFARAGAYKKYRLDNGDEVIDLSETRDTTYQTFSLDPITGKIIKTKIRKVVKIPINGEVVVVKLEDGSEFKLTPWHKVFVIEKDAIVEKRADELKIGDYVPVPVKMLTFDLQLKLPDSNNYLATDIAWLIGMFLGDGTLTETEVRFYPTYTEALEACMEIAHKYGSTSCHLYKKKRKVVCYGKKLVNLISKITKLKTGKKANKITIPKIIARSKPHIIGAFLAGYLEADGSIGNNSIKFTTVSKEMAKQLQALLQLLGIKASFTTIIPKRSKNEEIEYQIIISGTDSIWKFAKLVYKHLRTDYYRHKLVKLLEHKLLTWEKGKTFHNLRLKKIVEIRRKQYNGYFYDIEIGDVSNYIAANGGIMFVHNTWCTACVGGIRTRDDMLSSMLHRDIWTEGMAPRCDLISIKALGYVIGTGLTSQIIEAIDRAISYYHADVISMSLGGPVQANKPEDDPYYVVFDDLIKSNVVPVVATGNEGPEPGTVSSPGALPQVLTVGAYDPISGEVAKFSSRGPTPWNDVKPDCVAPGVNIHAPCVNLLDFTGDNLPQRYSILSGTSMATPHISGLVVLMRQAHHAIVGKTLTVEEIKKILQAFGHEKTNDDGWGMLTWEMYEMWLSTEYNIEI